MNTFELRGWHVLTLFIGAFGIIIGVNLVLAFSAVRTFPGLEVRNSYVASQSFDQRRASQEALGWQVRAEATAGEVVLFIQDAEGAPVDVRNLDASIGRATHVKEDISPVFTFSEGAFRAPLTLRPGNWNIRMTASAPDGTVFTQRVILDVH
ncbi:Nitrogen fixation protein FixH [Poseidonocella pacifica]|uniref:Nitrogen fixation protein FixH n=1 Tax=Poseidonocella pacifica TaxID=871651 RepID=A0A1I0XL61_9RHOB|nr:FixH family protein [Poseidonocella pacifica]SFB00693.1 Nitrogen fixation protein FixH [Poseidonocella pacifica]